MSSEEAKTLLEQITLLRGEITSARAPIVIHGRMFQLVTKAQALKHVPVSSDTFDRWVKKGYLPQPFDPERREGTGRKTLLWDLYEIVERMKSYQGN